MEYLVTWEIELDAESPKEAAYKAWEIMRAPDSTANHFAVFSENGDLEFIDLTEDND